MLTALLVAALTGLLLLLTWLLLAAALLLATLIRICHDVPSLFVGWRDAETTKRAGALFLFLAPTLVFKFSHQPLTCHNCIGAPRGNKRCAFA